MKIDGEELIDALEGEGIFYTEASDKTMREIGARLTLTAALLTSFRDTLISIALCQNGVPTHQAQDTLKKAGYCYHFNSIYHAAVDNDGTGSWHCSDCDTTSRDRPVAYR